MAEPDVVPVVTATGRAVHAYYRHAHRTACGLGDDGVYDFHGLVDAGFQPCARCAPFLPSPKASTPQEEAT